MDVLKGDEIAQRIRAETLEKVQRFQALGLQPKMAAIVASSDPGVGSYVRSKVRTAAKLGIEFEVVDLGAQATQEQAHACVARLAADPAVHGILIEMPLAPGLEAEALLDAIPAVKDVEGLTSINLGRIAAGREHDAMLPPTPLACILLAETLGPLAGRRIGVVGRGRTVGRPLLGMLLNRHATPTVCHTRTRDLPAALRDCEILMVGAGKAGLITGAHVRAGQCLIDAGINSVEGRIVGDVDAASVEQAGVAALSAVPGGVGPVTSALIFHNLVTALARQHPRNSES